MLPAQRVGNNNVERLSYETNKLLMRRFTDFINTASAKMAAELIPPMQYSTFLVASSRSGGRPVTSQSSG